MTRRRNDGHWSLTHRPIMIQLVGLCKQMTVRTTLRNLSFVLRSKALTPLSTCLARPRTLFGHTTLFRPLTSVALETKTRPWLLQAIVAFCLKAILHLHAGPRRAGVQRNRTRLDRKFPMVQALTRIKMPGLVRCFLTFASETQRAPLARLRATKILPWVPMMLVQPILMPRMKN